MKDTYFRDTRNQYLKIGCLPHFDFANIGDSLFSIPTILMRIYNHKITYRNSSLRIQNNGSSSYSFLY